jgi:hypothetical protein
MHNPYFQLHKEFTAKGARLLVSSGQACVLYGLAAFSKDGDWIIEETVATCSAILQVLESKKARYRLGAPLDIRWLSRGWSSHFEFTNEAGMRIRTDFVSRPPRISDPCSLWNRALMKQGIDVVDVEELILLKETRRLRDYSIIGAIADVCGANENNAALALQYLQDYDTLAESVGRWPEKAAQSQRQAVKLIVSGAPRRDVVAALALEQDELIQQDTERIARYRAMSKDYDRQFAELKAAWEPALPPLSMQHKQILSIAEKYLPRGVDDASVR